MARPTFDGVLIDFYGTISAGDREAVEMACRTVVEACGVPASPGEFAVVWGECFFATIGQCNHHNFRTLFECEAASLRDALARYAIRLPDSDLPPLIAELETYWADPPVYDDAIQFLHSLPVPVCCVSNADTAPLQEAIARHGLRFDVVVTSESVRAYKPDPAIFLAASKFLGIPPERLIHIGDSRHSDVGGAAGVGIATAWVCRESRVLDVGVENPDYQVRTLTELRGKIGFASR